MKYLLYRYTTSACIDQNYKRLLHTLHTCIDKKYMACKKLVSLNNTQQTHV